MNNPASCKGALRAVNVHFMILILLPPFTVRTSSLTHFLVVPRTV